MLRLIIPSAFLVVMLPAPAQQPARGRGQTGAAPAQAPQRPAYQLTAEEKRQIDAKASQLRDMIRGLKARRVDEMLLNDVEVYHKAARWMLEFPEEFYTKGYATNTLGVLEEGLERAVQLQSGKSPWVSRKGEIILGYRSALDGSIQPYGVKIPASYDGMRPLRLDVNLKGRANPLNEVEFIRTYIDPGSSGQDPQPAVLAPIRRGFKWLSADVGQIELDVFGRGNNAYHWAGEVDVFEAIADVQRRFKIDPTRIVLRGFSMGGCGAWNLALHNPDRFVAAEIGAGFTKSRRYNNPESLAPYQKSALLIYEGMVEYAMNMFNLPTIGHGGELDPQRQASVNAREQLEREGFHLEPLRGGVDPFSLKVREFPGLFLTGPQIGHNIHAYHRNVMDVFLKEQADRGQRSPGRIRFVTFTTRYNKSYWVTLDGLEKHYERAEVDAQRSSGGERYEITTRNLTRLVLRETDHAEELKIDGQSIPVKPAAEIALEKSGAAWRVASAKRTGLWKTHALQGPIDDAFLDPFLLVRPTGTPWNEPANQQALRSLARFDRLYAKYFRGHPLVKDDKDVTEADLAKYHLVLFGDPGSNRWIAKLNGKLPLHWTHDAIALGERSFPAAGHLPTLIYPNPLNASRYVVLNSGMTAEDGDYPSDFCLPRQGDFALLSVKDGAALGDVVWAGFFDDSWNLPKP